MKKHTKRIVFIAILVVVAAWIIIRQMGGTAEKEQKITKGVGTSRGMLPVTGIIAEASAIKNGIIANGTLYANEEVNLVAEIVGKVVKIYFQEGTRVRRGELLLKVDDADLQAQLIRAEFQEKLLKEKLERQRILLNRESISLEAFEQLQTDYNMLLADIALLKVKINRTEIRAPFDGVMGFRYVSEGSYVQPNTQIARIVDNSVLKLEVAIPERYQEQDLRGKEIDFQVSGSDKLFSAVVYAIEPLIEVKNRTILLRAYFDNKANLLMPGMFAKGFLMTDSGVKHIQIPTEAVVPEMNGKRMWVVKDGKASSVVVETEGRDQKSVVVLSGVSVGDTVLTGGLMQLREGMAVKVELKN